MPCNLQSATAGMNPPYEDMLCAVSCRRAVLTFRSRATETREPCQAGNRAALSGAFPCAVRSPGLSQLPDRRAYSIIRAGVCSLVKSLCDFPGRCRGMYQALYRKWRPQTFDDVIGQQHITDSLRNQIILPKLSTASIPSTATPAVSVLPAGPLQRAA